MQIDGQVRADLDQEFEPQGLRFLVRRQEWTYHERALLVMNKPAGYECSQRPRHHPSGVLTLLPVPLRVRGVQPVGRLDADTTGLLLFTDDGALIHRLSSAKTHVPKVYEIETADPVDERQIEALCRGVVLHDDPAPVAAAACEKTGVRALRMTLRQGKYHQVKRMVAPPATRCCACIAAAMARWRCRRTCSRGSGAGWTGRRRSWVRTRRQGRSPREIPVDS